MVKKCNYCGAVNYFNSTGYCKDCDRELPSKSSALPTNNQEKKAIKGSNPLVKIVDETVLDIKADYSETIDRLIALNGVCRDTDGNNRNLNFHCDKNGEITVSPTENNYLCFVTAKVYEENGKTKIRIWLNKRRKKALTLLLGSIYPIFAVLIAYFLFFVNRPTFSVTTADLCFVLVTAFMMLNVFLTMSKDKQNALSDLEIMKSEVLRRVKAVERWYD